MVILASASLLSDATVLTHATAGEYMESECKENGNTLNFYMLYENRVGFSSFGRSIATHICDVDMDD